MAELSDFLSELATDAERLGSFIQDPDAAMEEAELSEQDRAALRSGFANIIYARLSGLSVDEAFNLTLRPVFLQQFPQQFPPPPGQFPQVFPQIFPPPPPQYPQIFPPPPLQIQQVSPPPPPQYPQIFPPPPLQIQQVSPPPPPQYPQIFPPPPLQIQLLYPPPPPQYPQVYPPPPQFPPQFPPPPLQQIYLWYR